MKLYSIMSWFIILLCDVHATELKCPSMCKCSSRFKDVRCMHKNLESIPHGIPTTVTQLFLSFNKITQIESSDLVNLVNLTKLDLKKNYIYKIAADAFSNLTKLKTIYLTQNSLISIDRKVFSNQKNLVDLYLGNNKLNNIPSLGHCNSLKKLILTGNSITNATFDETFTGTRSLTAIVLSHNKIQSLTKRGFAELQNTKVARLDLSNNPLKSVQNGTFEVLRSLQSLSLSNTLLNTVNLRNAMYGLRNSHNLNALILENISLDNDNLPSDIFEPLRNSVLTNLEMPHNKLKLIKAGTFKYLQKLQILDLRFCQTEEAEPGAFQGLPRLNDLRLRNNNFPDVPENLTKSLKKLDLSHNYIKVIKDKSFFEMRSLKSLFLDYNDIQQIGNDAFLAADNIESLYLSFNQLPSVGVGVFQPLNRLTYLGLNNNKFQFIPTEAKMFSGLDSLQHLDFRNNKCHRIPLTLFSCLKNLATLLLQGNNLGGVIATDLHGDLFNARSSKSNLVDLHLDDNNVETLPVNLFKNATSLKRLSLSKNTIRHWHERLFRKTTSLEYLNLAHNQISLMNKTSLPNLNILKTLNLTANPFACTCDLIWFHDWVQNNTKVNLPGVEDYTCDSPQIFQGVPLKEFDPNKLVCWEPNWKLIMYISFPSLIAVILVSFLIVYKKRWSLRRYWFIMKMRARRKRLMEGERRPLLGLEFDAFISYCTADKDWVEQTILSKLDKNPEYREAEEYPPGGPNKALFKFYYDARDDIPGKGIYDNLQYGFEHSRKILIILSTEYFEDKHAYDLELQLIPEIEVDAREDKVIFVFKEDKGDVPLRYVNKIPRSIRRKVDNDDILTWTDDQAVQDLFWGRLHEELSKLPQPHYVDR